MNWDWASSLDQFWRSPTFPMWLTLAAAGFFGLIVLIMVLRAEKSVANGMLAVITLLAIGVTSAATLRAFGPDSRSASGETRPPSLTAALPALSCIDDLAGETVLTACEKALFGSAEVTAAALSYAAAQITRLTAFGDAATANLTPELLALRRAVERDRYGLMAYVLLARDRCTQSDCAVFRSLTNRQQLVSNMDERVYDGLVMRYSASWNAPPPMAAAAPVAALAPTMPTGKPTNAEFPSAASTPPVNIMTPEPGPAPSAPLPLARPTTTITATAPAAPAAAKKQPAPKSSRAAPVQLAPAAAAPAADDE
ncbi:hypothetical protein [Bradyrhizobium sp.]|uniref:hypothetical protein n=1 Tax=Bradyrhizobium sp. TaxID=376 RepID=UPI002728946F|nr:hypothetical protein [Bradyrhizobium sp.]MDO9299407.1 hypothetical protein [Bradyrhizobium sp.]